MLSLEKFTKTIRVNGTVSLVPNEVADDYYNSRSYESRIGAWASKQSKELKDRKQLIILSRIPKICRQE